MPDPPLHPDQIPDAKRPAWHAAESALRRARQTTAILQPDSADVALALLYLQTAGDWLRPHCQHQDDESHRPAREVVVWLRRVALSVQVVYRERGGYTRETARADAYAVIDNAVSALTRWASREQHELVRAPAEDERPGYMPMERMAERSPR